MWGDFEGIVAEYVNNFQEEEIRGAKSLVWRDPCVSWEQ